MKSEIILYLRNECHLCEDMHKQLIDLQKEFSFSLELRDVDTKSEWQQQYGLKVPVLFCAEKECCHYFLDLQTLLNYLQSSDQ
jgi:glutaredoxin